MYPGYQRYGTSGHNWGAADGNAVMQLPLGAMGGAQRLPMFGSGDVSGQAAHNFEIRLRVGVTALQNSGSGYQNRKKVRELVQYVVSHMEAGGTAYTWGQQMSAVLRRRYLNFIQRYILDPEIDDLTYADRCQAVAGTLHFDDLNYVEPTTGVSLKHILLISHVEFLRHNEYMLDEPAAAPAATAAPAGEGSQRTAAQGAAAVQDLYRRAWRQAHKTTRADALVPSNVPPYQRPVLPALPAVEGVVAAQQVGPGAPRQPRLVAELPWGPDAPSEKTLAGLQAEEAKWMADKGSAAIPLVADYACEGFRGEYVIATGDELLELQSMVPQGNDPPSSYLAKLLSAWQRAGGEAVWPKVMLVSTFMAGLLQGYPAPVHNAVQREIETKFGNQPHKVDLARDLCPIATSTYDGLKTVAVRKQLVQSRTGRGGQVGMGGRNQGFGQQGAGGSRGGQQHGQSSRQRAAHAALDYGGEEPYYQAYAAQHTRPAPQTYNTMPPPTQQQRQYHQGGSSRSECGKCGGLHGGVCFVDEPGRAHASWTGPRSKKGYIQYVENCEKAKLQPVRYMYKAEPGEWPEHVASYLKKKGVREPERPSGQAQWRRPQSREQQGQQQSGHGGLGSGYTAQATGHGSHYPSLEESFHSATMLHDEEEEYYNCWYVEAVHEQEEVQPAEALLTTTRAGSKQLAAATELAARRQQQAATAPAAGSNGEVSSGAAADQKGLGVGSGQQPAGAKKAKAGATDAAGAGRPPLPAPAAARQPPAKGSGADRPAPPAPAAARQLPARGSRSSNNPAVAASPVEEPEAEQPAAPRALPGGRAPPLPFTVNPIPAGTPPALYPQPVARLGKAVGTPQQVAVARGSIVQQLPVCVNLQQLARQLPSDALKQLLLRTDVELVLMQRSMVPGGIKSSDIAVNFSNIAEVLRVAQGPQAFTAESWGGEGVGVGVQGEGAGDKGGDAGGQGEGVGVQGLGFEGQVGESGDGETQRGSTHAGGVQEAQHTAWDSAAAEQQHAGVLVAAMCAAEQAAAEAAAEGGAIAAAFNTSYASAAGQPLADADRNLCSRPTAYQLLAQSAETPGITISLCDADGNATELQQLERLILDSGADLALMGEDCARRSKVPVVPSDRRIRTSSGHVTGTLSKVAAPVKYVLRQGGPGECVVYQDTYVMPGSGAMYDFLLGTPLINKWGMLVDPITSIATYRPYWHSRKDSHTLAHIPVLTAVDEPPAEAPAKGSHQTAEAADGCRVHQAAAMQRGKTGAADAARELGLGGSNGSEAAVAADAATSQLTAERSSAAVYEPPTTFMIMSS